ncbi:hypothetical protein HY745_14675 [Candidatus Desantisbacteria bacterium]|nr:hypothetical protein [Candidatus Desantisbacteria bacterium]
MDRNEYLKKIKRDRYFPGPEIINIYKIIGKLKTATPLHIGSGDSGKKGISDEEENNCALIERDNKKMPYIPGSSLRGTLRNYLETNLTPFNSIDEYDVSSLVVTSLPDAEFEKHKGITDDDIENKKNEINRNLFNNLLSGNESEKYLSNEMAKFYIENLDLIAGLFGSGRYKGKIEIDSGIILDPSDWSDKKIFIMPGVAIDQETGTAKDKSLFTYELITQDVEFKIEFTLRNVKYWELGMIFEAMNAFNHKHFPLRLGGLTNNGYGKMSCQIEKVYQIGDDDRKEAGKKVKNDIKIFNENGNWESFFIEKRGFSDINSFEEKCLNKFNEDILCKL